MGISGCMYGSDLGLGLDRKYFGTCVFFFSLAVKGFLSFSGFGFVHSNSFVLSSSTLPTLLSSLCLRCRRRLRRRCPCPWWHPLKTSVPITIVNGVKQNTLTPPPPTDQLPWFRLLDPNNVQIHNAVYPECSSLPTPIINHYKRNPAALTEQRSELLLGVQVPGWTRRVAA